MPAVYPVRRTSKRLSSYGIPTSSRGKQYLVLFLFEAFELKFHRPLESACKFSPSQRLTVRQRALLNPDFSAQDSSVRGGMSDSNASRIQSPSEIAATRASQASNWKWQVLIHNLLSRIVTQLHGKRLFSKDRRLGCNLPKVDAGAVRLRSHVATAEGLTLAPETAAFQTLP